MSNAATVHPYTYIWPLRLLDLLSSVSDLFSISVILGCIVFTFPGLALFLLWLRLDTAETILFAAPAILTIGRDVI